MRAVGSQMLPAPPQYPSCFSFFPFAVEKSHWVERAMLECRTLLHPTSLASKQCATGFPRREAWHNAPIPLAQWVANILYRLKAVEK